MSGSANFDLGGKRFIFPADERVGSRLFAAAFACVGYLDRVLSNVHGVRNDSPPTHAADLVTLYLAARIHGVTASGMLLIAHGLAKDAVHMERAQYEFFLKMLHYDNRPEKAVEFLESIPRRAREFAKRAKFAWPNDSAEFAALIEGLPAGEPDFVSLRDSLIRDSRFNRRFSSDPIVNGFLRNALANFRDHWLWASEVSHAGNLDFEHVIVAKVGDTFCINVDQRHAYPNRAIGDFAQRCFVTGLLIARRFGLEIGSDEVVIGTALSEGLAPHLGEVPSVKGAHD